MSNSENDMFRDDDAAGEAQDALDRATVARLAKLRTMPVELSRLEAAVASQIPPPGRAEAAERTRWRQWMRPMRAIAAGIALLGVLTIALMAWPSGAVMASPPHMARLHAMLVAGELPVTQVESVEHANSVLASQAPGTLPKIPALPPEHVMACCLNEMDNRVIACLLLKRDGKPVSMMVADDGDVRSPRGSQRIRHGGAVYHVQSAGAINMVMTARHGRWVCLMGELSTDALMELAGGLEF